MSTYLPTKLNKVKACILPLTFSLIYTLSNKQFLLLSQCFSLLAIGYLFNDRDFLFFDKICSKSSAAELSYVIPSWINCMWVGAPCRRGCVFFHYGVGGMATSGSFTKDVLPDSSVWGPAQGGPT